MIELLLINRDRAVVRVGASSRSQRSTPPSHCSIIDRTVGGRLSSSRHLSLLTINCWYIRLRCVPARRVAPTAGHALFSRPAIGRLLPVDDRTDSFRQQLLAKRFFVGESRLVTIGGDNLQGKTWGRNWIAPQNKRGVGVRPLGMGSGCD